jgi:hypothetical protein
VQTCSRCNTQAPDNAQTCPNCLAKLSEFSTHAVALKRFQQNPRDLAVRVSVSDEACPACQAVQGTYPKDQAPLLPVEGCSGEQGCRCFYEPILKEIYP